MRLEDVDIRCGDGWIGVIQKMLDELNAGGLRLYGLVADEDGGRLRLDYNSNDEYRAIARILVLAQCRAFYTCEQCGAPGEHRKSLSGLKSTRCAEHQTSTERAGWLLYDSVRTPWKEMWDGRWQYDLAADELVPVRTQ